TTPGNRRCDLPRGEEKERRAVVHAPNERITAQPQGVVQPVVVHFGTDDRAGPAQPVHAIMAGRLAVAHYFRDMQANGTIVEVADRMDAIAGRGAVEEEIDGLVAELAVFQLGL